MYLPHSAFFIRKTYNEWKECNDFGHDVTFFSPQVLLIFTNQQYQLPHLSIWNMLSQRIEYYPASSFYGYTS